MKPATTPATAQPDDPGASLPWLLGRDRRTRARVQQSGISFLAYGFTGLVMGWGAWIGVVVREIYVPWVIAATLASFAFWLLAHSERGARMRDETYTEIQIIWGIGMIVAGYAMCGPWRTAALFPMMLAMMFGALTIRWRRLLGAAVFGIAALAFTITCMHVWWFPRLSHADLRLDLFNLAFLAAVAPCAALLSVRFGIVKAKVKAQRVELEQALQQIHDLATRDSLTGLANRRRMVEQITAEHARSAREARPYSLALIDIDHFKRINDTFGHARGDDVLRGFAHVAATAARETDLIARWGGEEFMVLAPNTDATSLQALLERIRERLRDTTYEGLDPNYRVTASMGVATWQPGEATDQLIERADTALYRAKGSGRDRVEVAAPAPVKAAPAELPPMPACPPPALRGALAT